MPITQTQPIIFELHAGQDNTAHQSPRKTPRLLMQLDCAFLQAFVWQYASESEHYLSCAHKTIHFCWIPSHISIRGNEAADMPAKESLDQDISQVPYTDF